MAGFISQESIDEVSARTDIVRLIGEYVPLTQRGNDWWGCCPFHNEKTPSFTVSPEKKFYYCFGCHAGGTAFNFIMSMEKVSYPESVEFLAKRAGVQLSYTGSGSTERREDPLAGKKKEYMELYSRVAGSFHYMLMETEAGKFALDYITGRGISRDTIEKFKLGYSPQDRKWLHKFLSQKNYSAEFLAGSGLFSKKYPETAFFSDRLMFPIFDRKGEVVAMGGRFLRGDKDKSPKYLNSGDLMWYKKGSTLYAFNFARESIRRERRVIFCEGYMDCIAYHQSGITWAVAPLGTALTDEQIKLVRPFVDTVYLSFDSDGAGQQATKRAILMCRRQDISVRVIRLHGAKDPAEIMLNFGAEILTREVNCATLDNDYLLSKLLEVYPKDTPEGKSKASLAFFTYIDALQSDVQKNACLDQLCQAYNIDPEAARKDFSNRARLTQSVSRTVRPQNQENAPEAFRPTAELRAVLTAVTDDVRLFDDMRSQISVEDLTDPQAKKMFTIMEDCAESGTFSVSSILNRAGSDTLRGIIIQNATEYSNHLEESVRDSILLIKRNSLERKRASLVERIRALEHSALPEDRQLASQLLMEKMSVDRQIGSAKRKSNGAD
ncbi:MAG: DNA primase [Treponema sp.]|nr:DNA primase [Treponema sp.]